jgi:hypothetical protein
LVLLSTWHDRLVQGLSLLALRCIDNVEDLDGRVVVTAARFGLFDHVLADDSGTQGDLAADDIA